MLKKIILVILATVLLLAAAQSLTAQPPQSKGFSGSRKSGRPAAQKYPPTSADEEEKKILSVLDDMNRNQAKGVVNIAEEDGRILRLLTEATCAKHVVEIGTSNGYSAIWFCLALRTTGGRMTTYEMDAHKAKLARENFEQAGVNKLIKLIEGNTDEEVTKLNKSIDILSIDADKKGHIDYFNKLLPLVRPGGLILVHNIQSAWPDFIKAITTNPDLETSFQGREQNLGVILKKRPLPTLKPDVGFVPTPYDVVEKMLELAEVKKDDLVYDLGCGDGRIIVTAAKKYGCKAVGYDIDPERVKESRENVGKNNVGNLVRIEQKDIFTLDLSNANVITLYLLPRLNVKLIPQLEKLKSGSRIVSNDFDMAGVEPDQVVKINSSESTREHTIYLWTTPLKKARIKIEEVEDTVCPWCGNPLR